MDKNAIKKFAVWARTELIARVSLKSVEYGITEDNIEDANADSVGGKVLTANEKKQRQALIAEINDKGYKQVMEEVAYTWFNRLSNIFNILTAESKYLITVSIETDMLSP